MSKYFISADLEGVCGVASPLQCYPKDDLTGYHQAVAQLAAEVTAVIEGIREADPTAEILVNDAHSRMTNLWIDQLPGDVQLLSGKPKLCAMMAGLDDTFEAVMLVGYHARAGTAGGVINHTFHDRLFDVRVNDVSYGEAGINALYASLVYKVPVILASGDRAFCHEVQALLPQVKTVETKVGLTTTAAKNHAVADVLGAYRQTAEAAVKACRQWGGSGGGQQWLLKLDRPYTLTVTFTDSLACDVAMTSPLYTRVDGRTLTYTANSFDLVYRALQSTYTMLSYTDYMT